MTDQQCLSSKIGFRYKSNAGTVTITARSTVNTSIYGSQTITISALAPTVTEVNITSSNDDIESGRTRTLTATVAGQNNPAQTVTWSVAAGTGTATISGNTLTAGNAGTVTITARSTVNTSIYGSQTIRVVNPRHVGTYNIDRVIVRVWNVNRWDEQTHTSGAVFNAARNDFGSRVVVTTTQITFNGTSPLNNTRNYTMSGSTLNTNLASAFRINFVAAIPRDRIEIVHTTVVSGRNHTVTVRYLK